MARTSARELCDLILDDGSFVSWDTEPLAVPAGPEYAAELAAARAATGCDESVLTGAGTVSGRPVAVVASEFDFLAGSIGVAAAERITEAITRATDAGLPLLASPASGGTRMQEGTVAFLQMVKITAAVARHKAAHLPYLVYLRHPTTGGVFASWGSLGHITVAEPGALIGFLGPRVYEQLYGHPFPAGVQTAENLQRHGVVDAVLPPAAVRGALDRALAVIGDAPAGIPPIEATPDAGADGSAWDCVLASRRPDRPGVDQLLRAASDGHVLLSGTGRGESGTTVLALAEGLALPLVLVIDTAGPALSREAEEGGLAGEIARCLADLVTLDVPTVSVLMGQGSGGPALAMVPADRVLAARNGWLAPLPPEGASAMVFRDTAHAPELAAAQGVAAADLRRNGIVDVIVPELPDAAEEPAAFLRRLADTIAAEVAGLRAVPGDDRMAARLRRYRRIGL